jgi:hypothetical protein
MDDAQLPPANRRPARESNRGCFPARLMSLKCRSPFLLLECSSLNAFE